MRGVHLRRAAVQSVAGGSAALRSAAGSRAAAADLRPFERRGDVDVERPGGATAGFSNAVIRAVNEQVSSGEHGRLFAVVNIGHNQYKVTTDDVIVVPWRQYVDVGEQIILEKVLLVGAKDFTLVGRPLLPASRVRVEATVIEKTFSYAEPDILFIPKKSVRRLNFFTGFLGK